MEADTLEDALEQIKDGEVDCDDSEEMYKLNNGNGAVVCDSCSTIIEQNLSFKEYVNTHSGWDLCERCKSGITIVDNFDRIASMLEFNDKDEFYFLQIIQRKKDGNVTQIGNNGYRTIKTYYIYSVEQLRRRKLRNYA